MDIYHLGIIPRFRFHPYNFEKNAALNDCAARNFHEKCLTLGPPAQRTDLEVFHVMAIDLSKTKKNRSQKKTGE